MRCWFFSTVCFFVGFPLFAEDLEKAGLDWWALQPIQSPQIPWVKNSNWTSDPIDRFILAKLEEKGLQPNPVTDRRTLIRRLTFDVIGLPPTPSEVEDFLNDSSPNAYEKVVDRLLATPHYGERWARHWLDVVRFAESHGFEYDRLRDHAWRYRDYVIQSFNSDKPYGQFIREQLAGDAITPTTSEGIIATALLVAGPYDQAGNSSASQLVRAKAREDELEDLLSTVSQTFLGLTVNCARCHNHKFDPIPAKDYYRLKAVFDGVFQGDRSIWPVEEQNRQQAKIERHQKDLAELEKQLDRIESIGRERILKNSKNVVSATLPKPISRWSFEGTPRDQNGLLHAELKEGAKIKNGRLILNGRGAFAQTSPLETELRAKTLEAWVLVSDRSQRGGGVITIQDARGRQFDSIVYGENKPRKWMSGSNFFVRTQDLDAPEESKPLDQLIHIAITYSEDHRIAIYRDGVPYGQSYIPSDPNGKLYPYPKKSSEILFGLRHTGAANGFFKGEIEEARLYDRALSANEVHASYRAGIQGISLEQILAALNENQRKEHQSIQKKVTHLRSNAPLSLGEMLVYGAKSKQPGPTHYLWRGDVENKKEIVTPGPLSAVKGPPSDFDLDEKSEEGVRRIQFADWVSHPQNPLTWRVIANRLWQHHFGEGLVRTPNDFGFNGSRPSHPELLDYLASKLVTNKGSLKSLHKQILMSSTYRQSSMMQAKAGELDSDNRLLWRYPLRRLDAEVVRDSMLAISSQLNTQEGGPSFRPFRVENFNSAFYILLDLDTPSINRRSIYRMNVNSAKDPVLDVLDCPDPSTKTPKRGTTTTPIQALALMNNSFIQRMSQKFADRLVNESGNDLSKQIQLGYQIAFGRLPNQEEHQRAQILAKEHGLKQWCWTMMNASEFVFTK